jgi:Mn-dependent DtxR family transcriptional regulator
MLFIEHGIDEHMARRLEKLFDDDGPFDEMIQHLKPFTKAETEVSQATHDRLG